MKNFEIIVIIFAVVLALLALAERNKFPVPVVLVLTGTALGFIPSLPIIVLDPDVIFFLFLPPILFEAATQTSWIDFKKEIKPISTLAIALVFLTTTVVAITCYSFIPGFTWPLAFLIGAIVSPPDAVASTTITKGLSLDRRVLTILHGESLVNDASALIAYKFAIGAVITGTFVLWKAGIELLLFGAGGILAGIVIAYAFLKIHLALGRNSTVSTPLTLLTPFVAYLAAEQFHTSGVLAVVSAGLALSWKAPRMFSRQTQVRNDAVWNTAILLLNGFIFILIGLQFPVILQDLQQYTWLELAVYGGIISIATILTRIIWVFMVGLPISKMKRKSGTLEQDEGAVWKNLLIVGWTGTRGVVSLAAALAIPLTIPSGESYPLRSLILFLTVVVIFVTLVLQGLSLPLLVRLLSGDNSTQTVPRQ
jgi:Na+/H+ antiporter